MTELEALKIVRDMATEFTDTHVLSDLLAMTGASGDAVDLQKEAIAAVDALLAGIEKAETSKLDRFDLVLETMLEGGDVPLAYICASNVRNLLEEGGAKALAETLTDKEIADQVHSLVQPDDMPVHLSELATKIEWEAAENIAKAHGVTLSA